MFKMFHPKYFAVAIAWMTILIVLGFNAAAPFLERYGIAPKLSWAVLAVQLAVTVVAITPLWRVLWWAVRPLNRWVFPDLNGEWDVEGETNWPRIDATLKAANHEMPKIDMRAADEDQLPPLSQTLMRARIKQSWLRIRIDLWNPREEGPIKESRTLSVDPLRGEEGRHGLVYVFEQENAPQVVSDDRLFHGAGLIVQDRDDPDLLCGRMWTDRMWRRGMNTAADVRFRRRRNR